MPGIIIGRQNCASGQFYLCSSNGWRGCCNVDPCNLKSCPSDAQGDGASSAASSATASPLPTITVITSQQSSMESASRSVQLGTPVSASTSSSTLTSSSVSSSTSASTSTTTPNMQNETQSPTTQAPAPTSTSTSSNSNPSRSPNPAIFGLVIGLLVLLGILVASFLFFRRRRKRKAEARLSAATLPSPSPPSYSSPSTLFAEFGGFFKRSSKQRSPGPPSYPSSPFLRSNSSPESKGKHMLDSTPVAELSGGAGISELPGSETGPKSDEVVLPDSPTMGNREKDGPRELDGMGLDTKSEKPKMPPRPERMLGSEVMEGIGPSLLVKKGEGSPKVGRGQGSGQGHVLSWSGVPDGRKSLEGRGLGIEGVKEK